MSRLPMVRELRSRNRKRRIPPLLRVMLAALIGTLAAIIWSAGFTRR